MVKPKLISDVAVLTQAISVRSWARRVRSAASWVASSGATLPPVVWFATGILFPYSLECAAAVAQRAITCYVFSLMLLLHFLYALRCKRTCRGSATAFSTHPRRLPGPAFLDLHYQRPAQKRANEHEQPQN